MAINTFPFNSVNNDRLYDAKGFRLPFANFFVNGIFLTPGDPINSYSFHTTVKTGTTVTVKKGTAFINGLIFQMDADLDINIDIGDSLAKRIDILCIQIDETNRLGKIAYRKGTVSNNPVPPSLIRNNDIYELCIAQILVNQATTTIKQGDITDTRVNNNLCGVVHGAVEQVDTDTFFTQYKASLSEQRATQQTEFNNFINSYRNTIAGVDPGGKVLTEMVDARQGKANLLENVKEKATKTYVDELVANLERKRTFTYVAEPNGAWEEWVEIIPGGININGVDKDLKVFRGRMTLAHLNKGASKKPEGGLFTRYRNVSLNGNFTKVIQATCNCTHWAVWCAVNYTDSGDISVFTSSYIENYANGAYTNHNVYYEVFGY